MLKIFIARHGQNEDNANGILNGHRDMPLTSIGIEQAKELSQGIKSLELTFDAIYTSPLSRAKKTAEIIGENLNLKPIVLDTLIERNFGEMTGKSVHDIKNLCAPDIFETDTITYFLSPSGAETFPQLLERAHLALNYLRSAHTIGTILVATHGDFGKMLYAAYYSIAWQEMLSRFHFGNCELLMLAEGADPDKSHIIKITQHNH